MLVAQGDAEAQHELDTPKSPCNNIESGLVHAIEEVDSVKTTKDNRPAPSSCKLILKDHNGAKLQAIALVKRFGSFSLLEAKNLVDDAKFPIEIIWTEFEGITYSEVESEVNSLLKDYRAAGVEVDVLFEYGDDE